MTSNRRPSKSISLRALLILGLGGLFLLTLTTLSAIHFYVDRTQKARMEAQMERQFLGSKLDNYLTALINEESGLRGYLVTGNKAFLEPYHLGLLKEEPAMVSYAGALPAKDLAMLSPAIESLREAARAWHDEVAEPQIAMRRQGSLGNPGAAMDTAKPYFDTIRARQADLLEQQSTLLNLRIERLWRAERQTDGAALGLLAMMTAATFALSWWILRHTAEPLRQLAEQSESGQHWVPLTGTLKVQEIQRLNRAIQTLQDRVQDRQETLHREREEVLAINAFGDLAQQLVDEEELCSALAKVLNNQVAPSRLHILIRNASENHMSIALPETPYEEQIKHPILDEPMKCRGIRTAQQVLFDDVHAPTACICPLGVPEQGSYLCIPMTATGQAIGLVNLQSDEENHWTSDRRRIAQSYVSLASSALNSIRLLAASRDRALRDSLTRLHNRRFLAEYLPKQVSQALRSKAPLCALMLDIDHFKRFNDEHGHDTGDRVLTAFADCLQSEVRESDMVVRYGGEEFMILLPDTPYEQACLKGERIRAAVADMRLRDAGLPVQMRITTSIGVACLPEHAADGDRLIHAADQALYKAKSEGRDRVVGASTMS